MRRIVALVTAVTVSGCSLLFVDGPSPGLPPTVYPSCDEGVGFPVVDLALTAVYAAAAIGVNVNVPIFNGGLYKARRTEAELRAKATMQNVTHLENRVARDVHVAFRNASTSYDRMALTKQLLEQAQLALDLAQARYDLGLGSIVELSQAQLGLTSAQIANTSAQYDYQAQRVAIDYATGLLR